MITPKRLIQKAEKFSSQIAFSIKDKDGKWKHDSWSEFCEYVFKIGKLPQYTSEWIRSERNGRVKQGKVEKMDSRF